MKMMSNEFKEEARQPSNRLAPTHRAKKLAARIAEFQASSLEIIIMIERLAVQIAMSMLRLFTVLSLLALAFAQAVSELRSLATVVRSLIGSP